MRANAVACIEWVSRLCDSAWRWKSSASKVWTVIGLSHSILAVTLLQPHAFPDCHPRHFTSTTAMSIWHTESNARTSRCPTMYCSLSLIRQGLRRPQKSHKRLSSLGTASQLVTANRKRAPSCASRIQLCVDTAANSSHHLLLRPGRLLRTASDGGTGITPG